MSTRGVRRFVIVSSAALLITAVLAFLFYEHGASAIAGFLLRRPVTQPTGEEYAVYSAFVDALFSSQQPFRADQSIALDNVIFLVDRTWSVENNA